MKLHVVFVEHFATCESISFHCGSKQNKTFVQGRCCFVGRGNKKMIVRDNSAEKPKTVVSRDWNTLKFWTRRACGRFAMSRCLQHEGNSQIHCHSVCSFSSSAKKKGTGTGWVNGQHVLLRRVRSETLHRIQLGFRLEYWIFLTIDKTCLKHLEAFESPQWSVPMLVLTLCLIQALDVETKLGWDVPILNVIWLGLQKANDCIKYIDIHSIDLPAGCRPWNAEHTHAHFGWVAQLNDHCLSSENPIYRFWASFGFMFLSRLPHLGVLFRFPGVNIFLHTTLNGSKSNLLYMIRWTMTYASFFDHRWRRSSIPTPRNGPMPWVFAFFFGRGGENMKKWFVDCWGSSMMIIFFAHYCFCLASFGGIMWLSWRWNGCSTNTLPSTVATVVDVLPHHERCNHPKEGLPKKFQFFESCVELYAL